MLKAKLEEYGMLEWKVEELLKKKVLDTVHGVYTLEGERLFLTQDGNM